MDIIKSQRRTFGSLSRRTRVGWRRLRSRRLGLELLELRQMLSGTPVSTIGLAFQVVDDATANISFRYGTDGLTQGPVPLAVDATELNVGFLCAVREVRRAFES